MHNLHNGLLRKYQKLVYVHLIFWDFIWTELHFLNYVELGNWITSWTNNILQRLLEKIQMRNKSQLRWRHQISMLQLLFPSATRAFTQATGSMRSFILSGRILMTSLLSSFAWLSSTSFLNLIWMSYQEQIRRESEQSIK